MQTLSQKKKIAIIVVGIVFLVIVWLVWTGRVSLSGLRSDILSGGDYMCSETGQAWKLTQYTEALKENEQLQKKIQIASGEVSLLEKKKLAQTNIITQKTAALQTNNTAILKLNTYITKNCKNVRKKEMVLCNQKKQEVAKLKANNAGIQKAIASASSAIKALDAAILTKVQNITQMQWTIDTNTIFINQYELCEKELKTKLLVTSPLMSGEMTILWEVGKRAEFYKFSMQIPAPTQVYIDEIKFDIGFGPWEIELTDWYVTEQSTTTSIYPCEVINWGSQLRCQLEREESGKFGLENGRTQNYLLSARIKDIKQSGALKIYGISKEGIIYNGSRTGIDNQSTTVKINYNKPTGSDKLLVTSPLMSGEVIMSGEVGKRAELYTVSMHIPAPSTAKIDEISFDIGFENQNIELNGWEIAETTNNLNSLSYSCTATENIVHCKPTSDSSPKFSLENGITKNFSLSANIVRITGEGSLKIYRVSENGITYNGGRTDIENQTNTRKIHYFPPAWFQVCWNGVREGTEECDDGNQGDTDICTNSCKTNTSILWCEELIVSPETVKNGGIINYECSDSLKLLCILGIVDPDLCKNVWRNVTLKSPDGTVVMLNHDLSGTFTVPSSPLGTYSVECAVTLNGQAIYANICKKTITNDAPIATLNVTGLNTQLSTPSQYIAAAGGATDASKASFKFVSTGGTSTITDLKFTITGTYYYSVTQIKIGNVSAPVVDGIVSITGLNIPIPEGDVGVNVDALISYGDVNSYWLPSGTTSTVALSYIKYTSNSTSKTICTTTLWDCSWVISAGGITAPTMKLVWSKPTLALPSNTNTSLVFGARNKIAEVTIIADNKGDIRIKNIEWRASQKYFNWSYGDVTLNESISNTLISLCWLNGLGMTCEIWNTNLNTGFLIPAGTHKTFSLFANIQWSPSSTWELAEINLTLKDTGFIWSDTFITGSIGSGFYGNWIYNFPIGPYTTKQ